MESAGILRFFHGTLLSISHPEFPREKPPTIPVSSATSKQPLFSRVLVKSRRIISSKVNQDKSFWCVKASETSSALIADTDILDKTPKGLLQKKKVESSTFPNGFEMLLLEVCDETEVAELKLKVGDFEMHLKRDIGSTKTPTITAPSVLLPTTAPPVPSKPMEESGSVAPLVVPQKPPSIVASPFTNVSSGKVSKLAALEALGSKGYVLISSPTVGSFRRGRTLKGKIQPPSCKEGDSIKEGQVIGFLDQFGRELPVRSDAAGEVLKVLCKDGEAVGYGDPLVAVSPSFHGIK